MQTKKLAFLTALLLSAAMLWGCGSNGSGGSDVPPPVGDAAVVGSSSCMVCHSAVVAQGWVGSAHANDAVAGCEGCHGGGQFHRGIGPIPVPAPGLAQCAQCHESFSPGFLTRHLGDDPDTDFTNTAEIEGYVYTSCLECHSARDNNPNTVEWAHNPAEVTIHKEWARSGHAGYIASDTPDTETVWGHYDWDASNRASCQRCHTATGGRNFLNNPSTYNAANNSFAHLEPGQNELLYCWACHSDVGTGALRDPGPITEVYAAATSGNTAGTATVVYPDIDASNVCMGCHIGREIGENITNDNDADGVRSFINSHYLAAGGQIFNVSGYEYPGQNYGDFGFHKNVGVSDSFGTGTAGPCVTCHMSGPEPHTFVASAQSPSCASCHGGLTDAVLDTAKNEFALALAELNAALAARGIHYFNSHPYFFQATGGTGGSFTNWNSVAETLGVGLSTDPTGTGWKHVMGAAFNYNLLKHDPGAYAHNKQYALKLIADSIDFLADGAVDGLGIPTAVTDAINSTAFAAATSHSPEALAIPITESGSAHCGTCHAAAPHYNGANAQYYQFPNATAFTTFAASCGQCHAGGDFGVNRDILAEYAESRHGVTVNVPGKSSANTIWRGGNTTNASCAVSCHDTGQFILFLDNHTAPTSNIVGTTTTGNTQRKTLACIACHTDVATGDIRWQNTASGTGDADSVTITIPGTGGATSVTFTNYGASHLCVTCHSGGRNNNWGNAISDASTSVPQTHYLPQGLTLEARLGYKFAGQTYPPASSHKFMDFDGRGACVTCHMGDNANHTWEAVTKDESGAIIAISSSSCASCHVGGISAAQLDGYRVAFAAALQDLVDTLNSKRVTYNNAANGTFTYLNNANASITLSSAANFDTFIAEQYAGVVPAVTRGNVIGAMFNLKMFINARQDPAAYVHNGPYALKLINDSIDYLNDGIINGN
ncbi:hypothetical protein [Geoalkalibacter sp.]|uniref:hypothetical protein n=1 Tax=Geoalkalibacter sp. TaxID=3041440 RepID=UPI00272EB2B1|nr:hypothetical protein [Geoalkalibacter sp.]